MEATLGRTLFRAAELDIATIDFWQLRGPAERLRYEQLVHEAFLVAGALQQRGLRKGDRVGILLPTHPDFYRALFGVLLAGGIPAAMYPPVRLGRITAWKQRTATMLQSLACTAVLTDTRLHGLLDYPVQYAAPRLGCLTVHALIREAHRGTYVAAHRDDIAVVQFSSGTTGHPRPIALTHANILSNARAILSALPGDVSEHSGVSWLPLYHDMGLIGALVNAILAPGPLTLIRPEHFVARPRIWLEALTQTRATLSVAPNFAYGLCTERVRSDDLDGLDLSRWRVAICGAETVHAQTLDAFARHFAAVGFSPRALTPVYGLAEATLAVTMSPLTSPPRVTRFHRHRLERDGLAMEDPAGISLTSLGTPIAGVDVDIRDSRGLSLPPARIGRVWVRGPGVMWGYLDQPEATRSVLQDGWLDTGDRGFLYDDELYLYGREKDVIIIRGHNVDPAHIEYSLTGIAELRPGCAAAFGYADVARSTEQLVLLAEYRGDLAPDEQAQLEARIRSRVHQQCQLTVSTVVLLPAGTLPRTSSGKIRRGEARQLWQQDALRPAGKRALTTSCGSATAS